MKKVIVIFWILSFFVSGNIIAQIPTNGLIGYWPFNGNTNDESGNGNNGISTGAVLTTDRFGQADKAYYFDGVNDYITINPVSDYSQIGDFSMSVWFYSNEWTMHAPFIGMYDDQYIFDGATHSNTCTTDFFRDGFNIHFRLLTDYSIQITNATRDMQTQIYEANYPYTGKILNEWHNIVFLREGDSTFHYMDGILMYSYQNNTSLFDMQHTLWIGTAMGYNPNYNSFHYGFEGKIDDICFYNRALSETEILDIYGTSYPIDTLVVTVYDTIQVIHYDSIAVTDTLIIDILTGSMPPFLTNTIRVFPNPTSDHVFIDNGDFVQMAGYKVAISNSVGSIIFQSFINQSIFDIDLSNWGGVGTYFLYIYNPSGNIVEVRKIILM